jgi:hypothetical protein
VLQLSGWLAGDVKAGFGVTTEGKNREMITQPAIFKWRQTESGLILCAVRWYLRYSLSLLDVEELLEERGFDADLSIAGTLSERFRQVVVFPL